VNEITTLRKRKQYLIVYEHGKRWHDKLMIMKVLANGLEISRFGFSVGREVGKAVVRNSVRRWLREIVHKSEINPGWDIVFIARREAGETTYHQLKRTVENLLTRAKLNKRNETVNLRVN